MVYVMLHTVPKVLEKYIEDEYPGGLISAIRDNEKVLNEHISLSEWSVVQQVLGMLLLIRSSLF